MFALFCFVLAILASPFKSNSRLEAENAALRHQLIVLRRKGRPGANNDRWFLVQLYRWFPSILQVITIFKPATIDGGIGPSLANGVGNLAPWEGGPDRDRPPCTDPADEHSGIRFGGASANAYKVFGTHNSIDYACGHCDTIFMHADQDQINNLVIYCTLCGSYNTTDA